MPGFGQQREELDYSAGVLLVLADLEQTDGPAVVTVGLDQQLEGLDYLAEVQLVAADLCEADSMEF